MRWQALVLLVYERVAFAEVPPVTSIIHSRWIKSQNIEPLGFQGKGRVCRGRSHSKEQWPSHDDCNFVGWRLAFTGTGGWHELYSNLSPHRQRLRYCKGELSCQNGLTCLKLIHLDHLPLIWERFEVASKHLPFLYGQWCMVFWDSLRSSESISNSLQEGKSKKFGSENLMWSSSSILPLMELVTWVVVSLVCLLESWKKHHEYKNQQT